MSFPCYSVLIPVAPWELASSLRRCLTSIYQQYLLPSQIVVSIDGILPECLSVVLDEFVSYNNSIDLTIIEALDLPRLPSGVGPTLQRGLSACRFEYVMRLDTDDVAQPERASEQLGLMLANPLLAVVGSNLAEIDPSGRHTSIRSVPHTPGDIKRRSLWRNPMNHPSVMMRTSAIIAVGGYADCPAFEDYHLWLRLLKSNYVMINLPATSTIATAGVNLISRRHGVRYALKELAFLLRIAKESLLSPFQVLLLIMLRVPTRLLPRFCLSQIMHWFLRGPACNELEARRAPSGQLRNRSY